MMDAETEVGVLRSNNLHNDASSPGKRSRSLSVGRRRTVGSSELLKDVYDRLNVKRQQDGSIAPKEQRASRASMITLPQSSSNQSSSQSATSAERRNPPCRLRSVWPPPPTKSAPTPSTTEPDKQQQQPSAHQDSNVFRRSTVAPESKSSSSSSSHQQKIKTSRSFDLRDSTPRSEWKDEKKEEDDTQQQPLPPPPKQQSMVQQRMRAFASEKPERALLYDRPPLIDIYEGTSESGETTVADEVIYNMEETSNKLEATTNNKANNSRAVQPIETKKREDSKPNSTSADEPTLGTHSHEPTTTTTKTGKSSHIADAFLAAINQTPPRKKVLPEVVVNNVSTSPRSCGNNNDLSETGSVSVLSTNTEENNTTWKQRRSKPQQKSDLERMIDERVKLQISELERYYEGQLKALESRFLKRMTELERKINGG